MGFMISLCVSFDVGQFPNSASATPLNRAGQVSVVCDAAISAPTGMAASRSSTTQQHSAAPLRTLLAMTS
jgi:hypothetical protein